MVSTAFVTVEKIHVNKSESYGVLGEPGQSAEWAITVAVAGQSHYVRFDGVRNGSDQMINHEFEVDIGELDTLNVSISGFEIDDTSANDPLPPASKKFKPADHWEDGRTYTVSSESSNNFSYDFVFRVSATSQSNSGSSSSVPSSTPGTNFQLVRSFDSMATLPDGKTYATFGKQYVRYSDPGANKIDAGYPKPIAGNWGLLPPAFLDGFDSMATLRDGKTYITKGSQYVRYSDASANTIDPTYPRPIAGNWGKLPATFANGFDTICTLPDGKTYITKGNQYVRYSDASANVIDPNYPRAIAANWGKLPNAFEAGFDTVCTLPNRKTYITRDGQYVRYSDASANTVDPGYPKPIAGNWG